jgi:hypothetical protein
MVEETKKVAWNASQGIIMEVSNRRSYANSFFINGDIKRALNNLIAIKQSVIQSFTEEERKKLKELEDKFNRVSRFLSKNSASSFNSEVREAFALSKEYALKVYSEYNDYLMDLLDDRGYLIGEQSDVSSMKF